MIFVMIFFPIELHPWFKNINIRSCAILPANIGIQGDGGLCTYLQGKNVGAGLQPRSLGPGRLLFANR